jgi:streptogramin lyase
MRLGNRVVLANVVSVLALTSVCAGADLLVTNGVTCTATRYDSQTGASKGIFITAEPWSRGLGHLAIGPDGNLYASMHALDTVRRYSAATGEYLGDFVAAGSGGLDGPWGLVFGPDGNLYVVSNHQDMVYRYNGATGAFIDEFVKPGNGLLHPVGLAFDGNGDLYVGSQGQGAVLRYDGSTGASIDIFVDGTAQGLTQPMELAFGPDGNLYICSGHKNEVLRYSGVDGGFIDVYVPSGAGLNYAFDLAFGPDGALYVAGADSRNVVRRDAGGCHVLLTDNNGADTLIFLAGPRTVTVDIEPGSCTNPLNVKASGVLPVAILGTSSFEVTAVDVASIRLAGVAPIRSALEDVATPVNEGPDEDACPLEGPDGCLDLTLKFEAQAIVSALGEVQDGDVVPLTLTGNLLTQYGGSAIEGWDCVLIVSPGKSE